MRLSLKISEKTWNPIEGEIEVIDFMTEAPLNFKVNNMDLWGAICDELAKQEKKHKKSAKV